MCAQLTATARAFALAGIRASAEGPLTENEVRRRLTERIYGAEFTRKFFRET
jgi:hypothetical protein